MILKYTVFTTYLIFQIFRLITELFFTEAIENRKRNLILNLGLINYNKFYLPYMLSSIICLFVAFLYAKLSILWVILCGLSILGLIVIYLFPSKEAESTIKHDLIHNFRGFVTRKRKISFIRIPIISVWIYAWSDLF